MFDLKHYLKATEVSLFEKKGVSIEVLQEQFELFVNGVKPAEIVDAATISNSGIKQLNESVISYYKQYFSKYKNDLKILKFVPASGAATRMFKDLFEYLKTQEQNELIKNLIENISKFAFYDDLNQLLSLENSSVEKEISEHNYVKIVELILGENGLNYGNLPKGLIKFHSYENSARTAFEEHIAESVGYATTDKGNHIHFTVSPEHKQEFEKLAAQAVPSFENKFNTKIHIDFSIQDPATDTMAVTKDNEPFRQEDDSILFRPGGHGALIYNLNKVDADVVFVKNIDNVVPDAAKEIDFTHKQALAGILLEMQKRIFELINLLTHNPSVETIQEAFDYVHNTLNIKIYFDFSHLSRTEKLEFLIKKLDRPIRVCGMVKNEGEPGGGPFFVMQNDKTASLQIVEKAQIDLDNQKTKQIFDKSTHFNPVDIVLSPKRYNGTKFDLTKYIDSNTAFIAEKSKDGKILKALELPGLWNGAMADWNTIFVEVPVETFNPVKTIFDLLRKAHQNH